MDYALPKNVKTTMTMVTPKMALAWLEASPHNRNVQMERVLVMKVTILRGQWQAHHQGICIDADGSIIDGQHRLWAIVEANVPVPINVTFGVKREDSDSMDKGKPRNISDELRMVRGLDHTTYLKALVATCARLALGRGVVINTLAAFDDWYSCFAPGVDWAVQCFGNTKTPMGRSPVAGALAFAHMTDPKKIETFGLLVRDGEGLKKGEPAWALRKGFLESQYSKRSGSDGSWVQSRKTLRGAQYHLRGETLTILQDSEAGLLYFRKQYVGSRKLASLLKPFKDSSFPTSSVSAADSANRASEMLHPSGKSRGIA